MNFTKFFSAIFVWLATISLILSSIFMVSDFWPRSHGTIFFLYSSTVGVSFLLTLSLLYMIQFHKTIGQILACMHIWLLLTFVWSGQIGGIWLRYFNIYNDGTTFEDLPLNNTFEALDWAGNNLPFDHGNPLYFTFSNWTEAVLRVDHVSFAYRTCGTLLTTGFVCRYCVAPLVYKDWEPGDPVYVWAGCSGRCGPPSVVYGSIAEPQTCLDEIRAGEGCFANWKEMVGDNFNETDYDSEYNFGFRHFQYIHKYREAFLDSPLGDGTLGDLVVFVRLAKEEDIGPAKSEWYSLALMILLTPLLTGMVPLSLLLFCSLVVELRNERTLRRRRSSNQEFPDLARRFEMDVVVNSDNQTGPTSVNFQELDVLPHYSELHHAPPSYEDL